MDTPNALNWAKTYISTGWSLIPIVPETKEPPIKWGEFQDRQPTTDEVKTWIDKGWHLAVVTGDISGVLVVDDDRVKHDLPEWDFQSSLIAKSATNGKHYYFVYDRELHSHQNHELHIDIKAWHSYALVPPFNGREWITPFSVGHLTPVDDEIVRLINSDRKKIVLSGKEYPEPLDMNDFVNIGEGARTDSLYRIACSLFCKMEKDDALRVLTGVNSTYSPPLTGKEFDYQVSRAFEFIENSRRQNLTLKGLGMVSSVNSPLERSKVQNGKKGVSFNLSPVKIEDIVETHESMEWLWKGYIAKGRSTLLSALWKSGKSTLLSHVILAMQLGKELAAQPTTNCNILILSEEAIGDWGARRDALGIAPGVWIEPRPVKAKLTYHEWVELITQIKDICKDNHIELLVVDTLSGFWSVQDENDAAKVQTDFLPINTLLEDNIAVLLIHHFRKSGGADGTASRGSGALGSSVDILVEFSRLEQDGDDTSRRTLRTYSRYKESPKEMVIELLDNEYRTLGTKTEVRKDNRERQVLSIIPLSPDSMSVKQITEEWNEEIQGACPNQRTLQRYIKQLATQRKIRVEKEEVVERKNTPFYSKITDDTNRRQPFSQNSQNSLKNKRQTHGNVLVGDACYMCRGTDFWHRADGKRVCNTCHPKP